MKPERWRKIESIFHKAVDADESLRNSVIEESCAGDEELRREVESLIANHSDSGSFIEQPAFLGRAIASDPLVGQIVSHYRVIQKLGGGGMGIVYKAEDLTLHRFVALKFLPEAFTSDAQALSRFRREAQAASSLNHPNICTIYEIGEQNDHPFIAMEFLEGQTLSDLIERRPLLPEQVADFGIQGADALEAAHSAGIIHRDIKPSNLFLTKRNLVKVLDFGLAKVVPSDPNPSVLQMPTVTEALRTNPGSAMGTITYMSPEQARGEDLDYRTDLFSFGAVLYEMATGQRAFSGNTVAVIHDAILNRTPVPPTQLKSEIPTRLDEIIAKALEKNREFRYRSAAEIRTDLQRLKRDIQPGSATSVPAISTSTLVSITKPAQAAGKWIIAGALLCVVLLVAGLYTQGRRAFKSGNAQPEVALLPIPFTSLKGEEVMPAFSPDGNQIVFAWDAGRNGAADKFDLYIKVVGTENTFRLTSRPCVWIVPAWSPDGRTIAFARKSFGDASGIFEVSAIGGPERKLAPASFSFTLPMSLSWSNDGNSLVFSDGDGVMHLLDHQTGELSALAKPAQCDRAWAPAYSPVELRIAFTCERNNFFPIFVVLPDGTGARQVTIQDTGPQTFSWSADGKRVVFSNILTNQLIETDVDSKQSSILSFTEDAFSPAVARRGNRLAYARAIDNVDIWGTSLDPKNGERHRMLVSSTRAQKSPDISPDGKRIVFESDRAGGSSQEIWISDIDGNNPVQLSHLNSAFTGSPRWSPNGHLIAFDSRVGGQASVYVVDPDGGIPKRLAASVDGLSIPTWSRDGNSLYACFRDTSQGEIYKVSARGGDPKLMVKSHGFIGNAQESRDGKWLYFAKGAINSEIRRVSANDGQDQALEGLPLLSDTVAWALADDGIYFLDHHEQQDRICFYDLATKHIREIVPLQKRPELWGGLSLSPDRKWLAYSQADERSSDIMLVNGFR